MLACRLNNHTGNRRPLEIAVLFWIAAVLGLYLTQLFIPSLFRMVQPEVGLLRYVGSRDNLPPLDNVGGRSERAVRNFAESLPFFLTAAILTVVLGRETELGLLGAQIFFWARLGYLGTLPCCGAVGPIGRLDRGFHGHHRHVLAAHFDLRRHQMSLVRVVHRTPARPEICWSLMADFDNIDFFNPHIERSAHLEGSPASGIGTERQCDLRGGGGYLRERVIAWTEGRSYTVDIFDSTLPVDGITTTLGLESLGAGTLLFMQTRYRPRWGIVGAVADVVLLRPIFADNLAGVIAGLAAKAEEAGRQTARPSGSLRAAAAAFASR